MRILSATSGELPVAHQLPVTLAHHAIPNAKVSYFHSHKGNDFIIQELQLEPCKLFFTDILAAKHERCMIQNPTTCAELIISLDNTIQFEFDEATTLQLHERGMNIMYTPDVLKHTEVHTDQTYSYLSIQMPIPWLSELFHGEENPIKNFEKPLNNFLAKAEQEQTTFLSITGNHIANRQILEQAHETRKNKNEGAIVISTMRIIMTAVTQISKNHANKQAALSQKEVEKLYAIKKHFSNNLATIHSAKNLADQFHISRYALDELCKAIYGITAAELITEQRMKKAAQLLISKDNPKIETIAALTGYSEARAFSRSFNDYFKITPTAYRNRNSKTT